MTKKINKTDRAMIEEYVKLRGNGQPQHDLDSYLHIYANAPLYEQGVFKREMIRYKQAIDSGEIVAGQELKETRVPGLPIDNDD